MRKWALRQRRPDCQTDPRGASLRGEDARLMVRDHYPARIRDLVDWSCALLRFARS
jgi:hypothetical protein